MIYLSYILIYDSQELFYYTCASIVFSTLWPSYFSFYTESTWLVLCMPVEYQDLYSDQACKVTHSQVLGLRIGHLWKSIILSTLINIFYFLFWVVLFLLHFPGPSWYFWRLGTNSVLTLKLNNSSFHLSGDPLPHWPWTGALLLFSVSTAVSFKKLGGH